MTCQTRKIRRAYGWAIQEIIVDAHGMFFHSTFFSNSRSWLVVGIFFAFWKSCRGSKIWQKNEFTTGGRGDDGDAYGIEIEVIYKWVWAKICIPLIVICKCTGYRNLTMLISGLWPVSVLQILQNKGYFCTYSCWCDFTAWKCGWQFWYISIIVMCI